METKITISKELCELEAVKFIARRYDTTPEKLLLHYFVQRGIINSNKYPSSENYSLAPNEVLLLQDIGAQPTIIEII